MSDSNGTGKASKLTKVVVVGAIAAALGSVAVLLLSGIEPTPAVVGGIVGGVVGGSISRVIHSEEA